MIRLKIENRIDPKNPRNIQIVGTLKNRDYDESRSFVRDPTSKIVQLKVFDDPGNLIESLDRGKQESFPPRIGPLLPEQQFEFGVWNFQYDIYQGFTYHELWHLKKYRERRIRLKAFYKVDQEFALLIKDRYKRDLFIAEAESNELIFKLP